MAIFQPVDVMGPAHRGAQLQQIAQSAAQAVLQRQRARKAIQSGLAGVSNTASQGGPGLAIKGSTTHPATGMRGQIQTPRGITADQLAAMTRAAAQLGHMPDGRAGGVYGGGGGGFDFGSLPSSSDPRQGYAATQATAAVQGGGVVRPSPPAGTPYVNPQTQQATGNSFQEVPHPAPGGQTALANPQGQFLGDAGMNGAGGTLATIPLGGGMYYDPATDSVVGGPVQPGVGGQSRFLS